MVNYAKNTNNICTSQPYIFKITNRNKTNFKLKITYFKIVKLLLKLYKI